MRHRTLDWRGTLKRCVRVCVCCAEEKQIFIMTAMKIQIKISKVQYLESIFISIE